ncbi:MAG TPA: malto-oligosyltrehalose synthase [Acidimicrobiales bacterium]|nr:malto-oligosyltrehalose synthase [Acidimicrobiales bacterium]
MPAEPSAPGATYRIQLRPDFGFDEVADVAPYLADLGVTHLYASPYLQAAPGSTHGYDVVDHSQVNRELGGGDGHRRMCAALAGAGLGQILDIVPNHMAIGTRENSWWWDVLENGPSSMYASYFDVDWDPPEAKLRNTVLLPILGDHYGRVLEAGDIRLVRDGGSFTVTYHEHVAPVTPRSLDRLLGAAAERCERPELESLASAFGRLPMATDTDGESRRERHRDKEVLRASLERLCHEADDVATAIDTQVEAVNADPHALDVLLERQNYRLAYWRTAGRELDYRRFFDISTLIGLRMEDPQVFEDTHALVLGWLSDGLLDGVRIDHPDGLRDPEGYLRRLDSAGGGRAWIVVEKILERDEELPSTWPVAGTTGYDFLNRVGGLFLDPAGAGPLLDLYGDFTGEPTAFADVAIDKKHQALCESLAADLARLAELFVQVCERNRRYRDYTRHELHEVLREVVACFPVYRSYVRPEDAAVSMADVTYVEQAVAEASQRRPELDGELFGFLQSLILLRVRGDQPPGLRVFNAEAEAELVARFQQLTSPVTAKGVEDTAFYTYLPLTALNEVGGDPAHFGTTVGEFHSACAESQADWPTGMTTTATHDTKRGEDVRARLALLSEIPQAWGEAIGRWSTHNRRHRTAPHLPDTNAEYLLYQTLVGAWPLEVERAVAYLEKASREAKVHTSWTNPVPAYDAALRSFIEAVLADEGFVADLGRFVAPLIRPGRVNSLAQTLVKLTSPGVPDTYQGTELWDLSLVDPDNRRPVDFGVRRALLGESEQVTAGEAWRRADEGLPKMMVTARALRLRRDHPEVFGPAGSYEPLSVTGARAEHVVAFARGGTAVTVVPRLVIGLGAEPNWLDTSFTLPDRPWRNLFSGEDLKGGEQKLADVFDGFPVALLEAR